MDQEEKAKIAEEILKKVSDAYFESFKQMNGFIVETIVRCNTIENILIKNNIISREELGQLVIANIQTFGKEIEKIIKAKQDSLN